MSMTNLDASLELTKVHGLWTTMHETAVLSNDDDATWVNAPRSILQSALAALSGGRTSEAVAYFDKGFKFDDHALALEFTDKLRLTEFFEKARELFPDSAPEVVSLIESGDHAIAVWKLTATQTVPYGSLYRLPVCAHGSTIVRVEDRRIVEWSDYSDKASSWRMGLASYFTEWIEL